MLNSNFANPNYDANAVPAPASSLSIQELLAKSDAEQIEIFPNHSVLAISGASGVIGSRLVIRALDLGNQVIAFVRRNSKNISKLDGLPIKIVELNSNEYINFNPDIQADRFIHLAWEGATVNYRDDVNMQYQNIGETLGAVELAHKMGCASFVFASSQAEVGIIDGVISENTPPFPENGYGAAKLAAGHLSLLRCKQLGIRHCRARIVSVYGEENNNVLNYVVEELLKGNEPILTKCEQMWDFMYIDDCCDAILAVSEKGKEGAVYTLGSGEERLLKNYIEQIRDAIEPSLPLGFGKREYYPHQPMRLCADTGNLLRDTGYDSKTSDRRNSEIIKKIINHTRKKLGLAT